MSEGTARARDPEAYCVDVPRVLGPNGTIRELALAAFEENRIIAERARSRARAAHEKALHAKSLFETAHLRGARAIFVVRDIRRRRFDRFGPVLASLQHDEVDDEPSTMGDDSTEAQRIVRATAKAVVNVISLAEEVASQLGHAGTGVVKVRRASPRVDACETLDGHFDEVDSALRELRAALCPPKTRE